MWQNMHTIEENHKRNIYTTSQLLHKTFCTVPQKLYSRCLDEKWWGQSTEWKLGSAPCFKSKFTTFSRPQAQARHNPCLIIANKLSVHKIRTITAAQAFFVVASSNGWYNMQISNVPLDCELSKWFSSLDKMPQIVG